MRSRIMLQHVLRLAAVFLLVSSLGVHTAAGDVGPAVVAKADYQLWPGRLDTIKGFDRASRAAILEYSLVLQDMGKLSDAAMLSTFHIRSVDRASVDKWLGKERSLLLHNYRLAKKDCAADDWTCAGKVATFEDLLRNAEAMHSVPPDFVAWRDNFDGFARDYVAEQLRLAALFPKVSSEIELFNANEFNGDKVADRKFFLTFDDGPTAAGGLTEDTLAMLHDKNRNGVFFVLGSHFQQRLEKSSASVMAELYKNQCVGSHGWEHKSHAKWDKWKESIEHTHALLKKSLSPDAVVPLFRPPYGQRRDDSGPFFRAHSLRVALWDLDSQDWNHHVSADDVINRMITLMLVKRHGVLLFHDVHPKAKVALPAIFDALGNAVEWEDCHRLAAIH